METSNIGVTPQKSILKTKSKSSNNPLRASTSTPIKSSGNKKKVEITTPPHSVKSEEFRNAKKYFKQSPIPRVAFLARASHQTHSKSPKKSSNRSVSSDKNGRVKRASPKKKKSSKKIKNKSKSVSGIPSEDSKDDAPNAGRQYMKELGTINQILKSVTDPATHSGHEAELIEGFVRPFSANELEQLLKSIGNVATIYQQIPGGSEAAETAVKGMKLKRKKSKSKSKILKKSTSKVDTDGQNAIPENVSGSSSTPTVSKSKTSNSSKAKKAGKTSSRPKSRSSSKQSSSKISKKLPTPTPSTPSKPRVFPTAGMSKPVGSSKSLKSNPTVKALYKPPALKPKARKKKPKKKLSKLSDEQQRSSDSVISELSELDLIKSALLNKKFFEESMALERGAYDVKAKRSTTSRKRSASRDVRKKSSKQSSAADEFVENLSSLSSVVASAKSEDQKEKSSNGLKTLEETLGAISEHHRTFDLASAPKTHKDFLINHSHVIRDPEFRMVAKTPLDMERQNNRGFTNPRPLPFSQDLNLDEVQGFDKHLQRIKFQGSAPLVQGLLDIPPPTTRLVANATELTGKYLRNERILEETRNKASLGSGRKESTKEDVPEQEPLIKYTPKEVVVPVSAPTATGNEKLGKPRSKSRSKGKFSKSNKKTTPNHSKFAGAKKIEPKVENLTKPPTHWLDNSVSASKLQLKGGGSSRWTDLNQKTIQKSRELKSQSLGRRRDFPKDDWDAIRRTLESSDERKQYLDNIVNARANFDTYNVFYNLKDQESKNNHRGPLSRQNDNFNESHAFDPRTNSRGRKMF